MGIETKSILYVEDIPELAETIVDLLQFEFPDIHVSTATNSHTASELLNGSRQYGLIITDMSYPGFSGGIETDAGFSLIKHVHDTNPDMPFLVLAGGLSSAAQDHCDERKIPVVIKASDGMADRIIDTVNGTFARNEQPVRHDLPQTLPPNFLKP